MQRYRYNKRNMKKQSKMAKRKWNQTVPKELEIIGDGNRILMLDMEFASSSFAAASARLWKIKIEINI